MRTRRQAWSGRHITMLKIARRSIHRLVGSQGGRDLGMGGQGREGHIAAEGRVAEVAEASHEIPSIVVLETCTARATL